VADANVGGSGAATGALAVLVSDICMTIMQQNIDVSEGRMTKSTDLFKEWKSDKATISFGRPFHDVERPTEHAGTSTNEEIGIITAPQTTMGHFGDDPIRRVDAIPRQFYSMQVGTFSRSISEVSCVPVVFRFSSDLRKQFVDMDTAPCALDEPRAAFQMLRNADAHIALARDFLDSGGYGGNLRAENLLMLMLSDAYASLANSNSETHIRKLSAAQLIVLTDYIDSHLDDQLTIEKLASLVNISPFYFARLFKATTDLSPHKFVVKHRLERAKALLRDTPLSIAQVAFDVGFSSQSHLTTAFRKEVGATPKQYQRIRAG